MVFEIGNTLGVRENIDEKNLEAAQKTRLRIDRFKFLVREKGLSPRDAKKKVIEEFQLNRNPKAGTPVWMTRGRNELIAEGFDYKASARGPENVGGVEKAATKRKNVIGEGRKFEERIKRTKQKTGLGRAYELAHTANIFQAKKLGIDYPIDALAIQTENVNNKVAEALNDELKPLYRKQLKLVNKLKRKSTEGLKNQLYKVNEDLLETVATGGKQGSAAANVLKPIIVNPDTLKGYIYTGAFDESSEIMASPGATTKGTIAKSSDDLMARANVESRLQNVRNQFENNTGNICSIFGKANGGSVKACLTSFDNAVKKNPEGLFNKILNFAKRPGLARFGLAGAAGAVGAGLVKQFRNDDPTTYLSDENQQKNMLVDMATDSVTPDLDRPEILDYQLPVLGAEAAAGLAVTAPSTIKASKSRALGIEKKRVAPGTIKTGARVLGRGLASLGTPAALLPMEAMNITSQLAEGDSAVDIATDPLNYLGATFASPATKIAARGVSPKVAKILRLGMSPRALGVLSRFGGLGLAGSLGIMGVNKLLED